MRRGRRSGPIRVRRAWTRSASGCSSSSGGTTSTSCGTGCPRAVTSRGRWGRGDTERRRGGCAFARGAEHGRPGGANRGGDAAGGQAGAGVSPGQLWLPAGAQRPSCAGRPPKAVLGKDWVLDIDVRAFFGSVPHSLLLKAVAHHTSERWVLLYVARWLKAPMQMPDGTIVAREKGTPQGSPISPVLANLFMHYAFDTWMDREFPGCPFERYADDGVAHCDTEDQARKLRAAIEKRLGARGLQLHPAKTKIVYCKDANRPGSHEHTSLRLPGLHLPGPPGQRPERLLHRLLPGHQHQGEKSD